MDYICIETRPMVEKKDYEDISLYFLCKKSKDILLLMLLIKIMLPVMFVALIMHILTNISYLGRLVEVAIRYEFIKACFADFCIISILIMMCYYKKKIFSTFWENRKKYPYQIKSIIFDPEKVQLLSVNTDGGNIVIPYAYESNSLCIINRYGVILSYDSCSEEKEPHVLMLPRHLFNKNEYRTLKKWLKDFC